MPTSSQLLSILHQKHLNSYAPRRLLGLGYYEGKVYRSPLGRIRGARLQYDPTVNFRAMLGISEKTTFDPLSRVMTVSLRADLDPRSCESAQTIQVLATTLEGYFDCAQPRSGPDLIKMDLGGEGNQLLKGCNRSIQDRRLLWPVEKRCQASKVLGS